MGFTQLEILVFHCSTPELPRFTPLHVQRSRQPRTTTIRPTTTTMSAPHAPKSRQGWAYGPPRDPTSVPTSVSKQAITTNPAAARQSAAAEARPIWRPTGTICSRLVYSFVFPLLRRGAKRALTQHDLPLVCPEDSSATRTASLSEAWQRERNTRPHGPRFWRALLASQRWYWTLILVLSSTAKIVATQCLGLVIESVSVAPEQFEWGPASA